MDKFKISLIQNLKFTADDNNTKSVKRAVSTLVVPDLIKSHSLKELKNIAIKIPAVCSTLLNLSRIIEITYFLKLTFDIEGPSIDSTLKIPLTIGNFHTH